MKTKTIVKIVTAPLWIPLCIPIVAIGIFLMPLCVGCSSCCGDITVGHPGLKGVR